MKLVFDVEVDDYERSHAPEPTSSSRATALRSKVRDKHAGRVQADARRAQGRYIWLGTKKKFDAFTFYFEENAHGMFQVHAYRFDADTSTFIVECDEASFRAAGLDKATTEESIAYIEELFGKHLGGEKLLANRSAWLQFPTVKNETWHHGNVVLLGDAAHTAHFSIGSGTKLAMEDSIALVKALVRARRRRRRRSSRYEEERRPDRRAHPEGRAGQPACGSRT